MLKKTIALITAAFLLLINMSIVALAADDASVSLENPPVRFSLPPGYTIIDTESPQNMATYSIPSHCCFMAIDNSVYPDIITISAVKSDLDNWIGYPENELDNELVSMKKAIRDVSEIFIYSSEIYYHKQSDLPMLYLYYHELKTNLYFTVYATVYDHQTICFTFISDTQSPDDVTEHSSRKMMGNLSFTTLEFYVTKLIPVIVIAAIAIIIIISVAVFHNQNKTSTLPKANSPTSSSPGHDSDTVRKASECLHCGYLGEYTHYCPMCGSKKETDIHVEKETLQTSETLPPTYQASKKARVPTKNNPSPYAGNGMKVLLLIACCLLHGIIITVIESTGIRLGAIPMILLVSVPLGLYWFLCKKWTARQVQKAMNENAKPVLSGDGYICPVCNMTNERMSQCERCGYLPPKE